MVAPVRKVEAVVDLVTARPGLSRAAAARLLGGRRATALSQLQQALDAGLVHEEASTVPIRGGASRTVPGLFPGPAQELEVSTGTSGHQLRLDREAVGVPAAVLAEALGVSRGQLHRWETGAQVMPAHVRPYAALERAQTDAGRRPQRRRDARTLQDLLLRVRRSPGCSRYTVVRTSPRRRALLQQALDSGRVHEAPTWTGPQRREGVGLYPGPAPLRPPVPLLVSSLHQARVDAGWSREAMARNLSAAGAPVSQQMVLRWERTLVHVPGWVAEAAATALLKARGARRDDRGAVLAAIAATPGLSRKALVAHLGFVDSPRVKAVVAELLHEGLVHDRHAGRPGQRDVLYPGPMPAESLTAEELRALRVGKGLRQADVADVAGVHLPMVRGWETGAKTMTVEVQQRLRAHLESLPERVDVGAGLQDRLLAALTDGARFTTDLVALRLGTRLATTAAVEDLARAGRIHRVRLGAGPDRHGHRLVGKLAWAVGPTPVEAARDLPTGEPEATHRLPTG